MKKRVGVIILLLIMIGILLGGINLFFKNKSNSARRIVVGTSGTYYPFTFSDGDRVSGFEIDLWNEIGKRLNYDIEYKTASFSGLFGLLDSKKVNVISNQITVTDERKEKYYFSEPYVESGAQIIIKNDYEGKIESFEDLKGKKVGVDLGSNYENLLRGKDKSNEIDIVTYQSTDSAFNDLMIGRIDAVVIDKISAVININEKNLPLKLAGEPFEKVVNAFPFIKNDENLEFIKTLNNVLDDMKNDGTLQQISNKWLNIDVVSYNSDSFFNRLIKGIFSGAKTTLALGIISMIIGLIIGTIISIIKNLKVIGLTQILSIYVSFFRGTPVLVQLFLLYFGLPQIFPALKGMSAFTAAYIGLGLNASAYIAEALRAGFETVDKGQLEAALAIGMTRIQATKRIILPQVFRMSIPSLGNIYIDVIKGSSLAFTLGVTEILAKSQMLAAASYRFFESYIAVAIIYWVLIGIFNYLQRILEKRLSIY